MNGKWRLCGAVAGDADAVARLRNAAAERLSAEHGEGHWSRMTSAAGVLARMKRSRVFVALEDDTIVATLTLATRKPWAIDRAYFSTATRPLYLTDMAVDPGRQRRGIGRRCLEEVAGLTRAWPADAVCLDAYDGPAGAGGFYRRCGYRETGRASYRGVPLVYLEFLP